ncbi:NAD(P)-binding protein [Corynespora cassiicola Philippines]|uniref:D-xylose 1-dehydrogenase (NADP(+), D-xylono-1,5-lactone-forming) n=1 Tax=Corynespora cassiicola Philippines TaxID=1448308 RepID=A0A2T2NRS0_CORCC|nr:NAD(P)-binding protein [Corynespora cassiicola Philippines]
MAAEPFNLRWGILATGGIAKTFSKDLLVDPSTRSASDISHTITAAASSTSSARASSFLREINAPPTAKAHGSYAALAADPDVDIVYVATPHSHHYQNVRLCLEAGKHVLCEKAFTVNAEQARVLTGIAEERGLFLMEAVWTRFFPLAREVREFVAGGGLGEVKRVWADLSFWNDVEGEFGVEHRMVNMDLAGGALLDLGIYSLTWVFQILYHILPEEKRLPPKVSSSITKYEATGCDEMTSVLLSFPGTGAHGFATTSIRVSHSPNPDHPSQDPIRIQGTHGELTIASPPYRPLSYTLIPAFNDKRGKPGGFEYKTVTHEIPGGGHGMFWEADECARCIRDGKLQSEKMSWKESEVIMDVMDEVRRQGDLKYPEKLESVEYPLDGF